MSERDGKKILIVDDDYSTSYTTCRILETNGYQTDKAYSGVDGMRKLTESKGEYDLILLDAMMPGMDGATTFYKMKELYPKIKITFYSAISPSEAAKDIIRKEGLIPLIKKPIEGQKLIGIIDKILGITGEQ